MADGTLAGALGGAAVAGGALGAKAVAGVVAGRVTGTVVVIGAARSRSTARITRAALVLPTAKPAITSATTARVNGFARRRRGGGPLGDGGGGGGAATGSMRPHGSGGPHCWLKRERSGKSDIAGASRER